MERLDEEMEEKEQQQHFGGGGKEDADEPFAKKSGVIEEETRTAALVASARERRGAREFSERRERNGRAHVRGFWTTKVRNAAQKAAKAFYKTVEKVERKGRNTRGRIRTRRR